MQKYQTTLVIVALLTRTTASNVYNSSGANPNMKRGPPTVTSRLATLSNEPKKRTFVFYFFIKGNKGSCTLLRPVLCEVSCDCFVVELL